MQLTFSSILVLVRVHLNGTKFYVEYKFPSLLSSGPRKIKIFRDGRLGLMLDFVTSGKHIEPPKAHKNE